MTAPILCEEHDRWYWPGSRCERCEPRECRDGGRCHHHCTDGECWRERHCEPLSGYEGPWGPPKENLAKVVFEGTPFRTPEQERAHELIQEHVREVHRRVVEFEAACASRAWEEQVDLELEVRITVEGEPQATHRWQWVREEQRARMDFYGDVTT